MKKEEDLLTMYRVANYYYNSNLSQSEIAALEGTSRPQISHLLAQAKKRGIVEIHVRMPEAASLEELAEKVRVRLGLQRVFLSDTRLTGPSASQGDALLRDVTTYAASLLPELLKDSRIIGIGRGKTIYNTSLYLPYTELEGPRVFVPLVGNAGNHFGSLQTSTIVNRFATQFCADGFYINSASILAARTTAFQDAELNQLTSYWDEMDAAVLSVGNAAESMKQYNDEDIPLEFISREAIRQARGEIFGQPYSLAGELDWFQNKVNRYRYIGLPLEKLRKVDNVICVACAAPKIEPLIAAAKLGYFKTLILDRLTAGELLQFSFAE